MKRIKFLVIVFSCLLCMAVECESDKCHKTIAFINNSSKEVYIYLYSYHNDNITFSSVFPNPYNQPNLYRVKVGEKNDKGLTSRDCLEGYFNTRDLRVFVFDSEVLANYSWGVIGKDYMVLKTIRPTLKEMQRNNWTITFTGE